jgi:hypothetical protein
MLAKIPGGSSTCSCLPPTVEVKSHANVTKGLPGDIDTFAKLSKSIHISHYDPTSPSKKQLMTVMEVIELLPSI